MNPMQVGNAEKRRRRVPGWLALGLTGLVTVLLEHWARPGADVVLVVAGGAMIVSAIFWARFWVSHRLVGPRRVIPTTRKFGQRHLDDRDETGIGPEAPPGSSHSE